MRPPSTWYRIVVAFFALLAACEPNSRTLAPDSAAPPHRSQAALAAGTVLLQEGFEDNGFATRGWYDNTALSTTTAQHIAGSTRALEVHFLPGAMTPTLGGAARHLFPATPTLDVSYWVKYSANWVGSGQLYHPHEFLILSDQDGDWDGPSNNWLTAYIEHNYQNGGIPRLSLQDNKAINTGLGALPFNLVGTTESRSVSGCNGVVERNVVATCFNMPPWYNDKEFTPSQALFRPTPGPGYKGDWNHVEVYFQLNSVVGGIGQADGVMQYWFNDTLVIDRHDVLFRTGARPNIQFRQFMIAPYIGDGSPVDQSMWVDNLTVATGRPAAPPPGAVASVSVTPASTTVPVGGTAQLTATAQDAAGTAVTGASIAWASSVPAVATVSAAGLVTAIAPGTATISATSAGVTGTATITVPVPVTTAPGKVTDLAVAGVTSNSVTLSFTEVTNGAGAPAGYDVRWAAGTLSWGSASEVTQGTCKVPLAGTTIGAKRSCTVLGLAPSTSYRFQLVAFRGTLNVNAVFGALSNVSSGTTGSATVVPVASVALSPVSASLTAGGTQQLTATLKDSAGNTLTGRTVTWASDSPAVATVSSSGLVTAVAAGTATVTATSEGKTGTAAITVTAVPVASVTVAPATVSQAIGVTQQLTATLKDASGNVLTGRPVTWTSSAPAIATVTSAGLEKAVAAGTATVTAASEGKTGSAAITVMATATNPGRVTNLAVAGVTNNSVTLSFTEVTDGTGQPASYDVRWAAGTLSWGSAAEVAQGTCKVPMAGTTIGAQRTCTVQGLSAAKGYQFQLVAYRGTLNVNAMFGALSNVASGTTGASTALVASVSVSPSSVSQLVGTTQQFAVTLRDAGGNVLTGRTVSWISSNSTIASVTGTGLETSLVIGTASVTATSEGQSGTAGVTVTALPPPPPPGGWPNEPAGLTVRTDWGMDVAVPSGYPLDVSIPSASGWHVVYEQSPGTAHGYAQLGSDASAPFSPAGIYDFVYPQGMVEGNAPATVYYPGLGANEVYAGFWWKPSAPFDAGPNGNKIAFMFNGGGGAGGQQFIILKGDGLLHVLPEYPGDYRWRDPNVNVTRVTLGVWHRVEWYSNVATGTMKYWLDGVLQGSYTDVRNSYNFDMFQFSPTWGGNSGAQKRETDHYWFDHVHLSVR